MSHARALSLLDRAALSPGAWPNVLEALGHQLGAKIFALMRHYEGGCDLIGPSHAHGHLEAYRAGEWWARDPRGERSLAISPNSIITDDDMLAPGERDTADFYRGFAKDEDVPFTLSFRFEDGARRFAFTAMRSKAAGPANAADRRALNALRTRAAAAAIISGHLERERERGLMEGLNAAGKAAIALDRSGKIVAATHAGEILAAQYFSGDKRGLASTDESASAHLSNIVRAQKGAQGDDESAPCFKLASPGRNRFLCTPIINHASNVLGDVHALLLLQDLDAPARDVSGALKRHFNLTRAEIEVATHIAAGLSVEAISHARGAAVATTRKILSAVFRKTGVARQGELAALLARLT